MSLSKVEKLVEANPSCGQITPINKYLPPELLIMVFKAYREIPNCRCQQVCICWIPVINVCSSWRNIALTWPSLWNIVVARSPTMVLTFISRSGDLPLSLWIGTKFCFARGPNKNRIQGMVSCLTNSIARIKNIHLQTMSGAQLAREEMVTSVSSLLSHPHLRLRTFSLHDARSSYTLKSFNSEEIVTLSIVGCYQDLRDITGTFPRLTSLTLHSVGFLPNWMNPSHTPLPNMDILSLLRSSPSLQFLDLEETYIRSQNTTISPPPVLLSNLRELILKCNSPTPTAFMLDHLRILNPIRFTIRANARMDDGSVSSVLVSSITKFYSSQSWGEIGGPRDVSLEIKDMGYGLGDTIFRLDSESPDHSAEISLQLPSEGARMDVINSLPLQFLRTFQIINSVAVDSPTLAVPPALLEWISLGSPDLESLTFVRLKDLSDVIARLTDTFLNLRTLHIDETETDFDGSLFEALSQRESAEMPLNKVVLRDCFRIRKGEVEQIERLESKIDVVWDGIGNYEDRGDSVGHDVG